MKISIAIIIVVLFVIPSSLLAESIAYTIVKPADNWMDNKFDAGIWQLAANWNELSKHVKGEVWIRFEAKYNICELNNLVIDGAFLGELVTYINGNKALSMKSNDDKKRIRASTNVGIGGMAKPDEIVNFAWHYIPKPDLSVLFAVTLKSIPMDYVGEKTPTSDYAVLEGNNYLRDPEVTVGRDGKYYMTGTSGNHEFMFGKIGTDGKKHSWMFNEGIQLYVSEDLKKWKSLGYVWQFDRDGTWSKEIGKREGSDARAVYAPEIHYLKKRDKYCICYGPNTTRKNSFSYGIGILEAKNPEGPYKEITGDAPICGGFDSNLFEDDDGSVYLLHNGGAIMKLKDDLSAPAEKERNLSAENFPRVGFEGVYLFKRNGIYYLTGAEFIAYKGGARSYSTVVAQATNIYGPYSKRYAAYPNAGHANVFQATDGKWYSTSFTLPGKLMYPGIFPVEFDNNTGRLMLAKDIGVPFFK